MKIEIGKEYVLNEDMKSLMVLKEGADITPIIAGTKCKVLEFDKEWDYVTLEFPTGQKVRTEAHMIDEI